MLFFGLSKTYSTDTLLIVFKANRANQILKKEKFYCDDAIIDSSKICKISNYYRYFITVPDDCNNNYFYEFVFCNYTVIDSSWYKGFMDTLEMNYKELFRRADGSLVPWFDENYIRQLRDPIVLEGNYINDRKEDIFFLSDLNTNGNISLLKKKLQSSLNTTYLIDITEDSSSGKLYAYKVSWCNPPSE